MTRSLTKELFTPFENLKREFHSSRKLSKTRSLDYLNSLEFNLISDLEDQFEEEETEAMAETMEEYMFKTRYDYGSELRDNTFIGSDHEDANEHIEKVHEIVDLFHIPKLTQDQILLRAFPMSLTGAASRWLRNKPFGSIKTWEDLKTKFLNKYCPPARTAKKMEEINNFQQAPDETLYQAWERFKELLMKCPQHYLTEMQEVIFFYNGLEVPTRQILDSKGAIPIKTVTDAKVVIKEMAEYSQKWHNGTSRTMSTETSDGLAAIQAQLNNLGREIKKVNEKVYVAQVGCELCKGPNTPKTVYLKKKEKPLKKHIILNLVYLSNKEGNIEQQLWDSTKEIMQTLQKGSYRLKDLDAYSIRTTLCNDALPRKEKDLRSFTLPCYINNVCFEKSLADLGASVSVMPLSTYLNLGLGELAHTKLTVELADRTVKHPKRIAENVLVGIVVEDMDPYLDKGMGDVIVGEPFYKASCVESRRFDGIITIRDGNDSVTYQMVRSNPRFKHLTNEKCNKIPPLLKVSEQDKINGISHSYQKLKGFYKGVLNLGPEFI
ncbi:hypothetical protein Tco_1215930 [Tanacetum coccineum]